MKITTIICGFFLLTVFSAKGQQDKYHEILDMLSEKKTEQAIIVIDLILHTHLNSPYDTLTQEFVWYGDEDIYLPTTDGNVTISAKNSQAGQLSFEYCSIFMRLYYLMWLISEDSIILRDSLKIFQSDKRAILYDPKGHIVFDYKISNNSYIIFEQEKKRSNIPISFYPNWQFTIIPSYKNKKVLYEIAEQYTQWIKGVKNEGLTAVRKKKIALLPDGYTWKVFE